MGAIPADYEVQPLDADGVAGAIDPATCGTCGRTWDDGVSTGITPAPSARCPFEPFHDEPVLPTSSWALAKLADCGEPDSSTSPGAEWLQLVAREGQERRAEEPDGDLDDLIWEVADGLVPIYTSERWAVFVDLAAWQEDLDEAGLSLGAAADLTEAAGVALLGIAQRLLYAVLGEVQD